MPTSIMSAPPSTSCVEDRGAGLQIGVAEHDEGAEHALAVAREHGGVAAHQPSPSRRLRLRHVLVAAPRQVDEQHAPLSLGQLQRMGESMGGFEGADDPLRPREQGEGVERLRVGRADIFGAAAVLEEGMLRARPRDNRAPPRPTSSRRSARPRPGAHRFRRRAGCPAGRAAGSRHARAPSRPLPAGSTPISRTLRVVDEIGEQAHRVGAAADAGDRRVGQPALRGQDLRARLLADHPLDIRAPSAGRDAGRRRCRADNGWSRSSPSSRAAPR